MTLQEAIKARGLSPNELIEKSNLSKTTIYNAIGQRGPKHKSGVRTGTLLDLSRALNAIIVIDGTKTDYFDVILRKGENEND